MGTGFHTSVRALYPAATDDDITSLHATCIAVFPDPEQPGVQQGVLQKLRKQKDAGCRTLQEAWRAADRGTGGPAEISGGLPVSDSATPELDQGAR